MNPALRSPTFLAMLFTGLCTLSVCAQTPAPPAPPPAPKAPAIGPTAADLIRDASHLAQQRNFPDALLKLDAAKAIDPRAPLLWGGYGYVAFLDNKPDEAIADFQQEIANHPDEENFYLLLEQTQAQQHKPQEAIATLQKFLALKPDNIVAKRTLAALFISEKDYAAAEKLLRPLIAANANDSSAQILLSRTLTREGRKTEATDLLKSVVENTRDLNALNDAAFTLADENLDLALAEKSARRSLAALEQQSGPMDSNQAAHIHTEMFVSFWDTLGWTLFCEGKAAEAETWVRPAWLNSFSAESGYHLGMILEKLNQPAKALAIYQLAAFGDPSSLDDTATNITTRQAALRKAGTPSQVPDAKAALLALHTFKVPGPNLLTGQALIDLEFSVYGPSNATIVRDVESQDRLTPVERRLYLIDFKTTFPTSTHVLLTRRGLLTCKAGAPCLFVLLSPRVALAN